VRGNLTGLHAALIEVGREVSLGEDDLSADSVMRDFSHRDKLVQFALRNAESLRRLFYGKHDSLQLYSA
jgi:hypothetical protein